MTIHHVLIYYSSVNRHGVSRVSGLFITSCDLLPSTCGKSVCTCNHKQLCLWGCRNVCILKDQWLAISVFTLFPTTYCTCFPSTSTHTHTHTKTHTATSLPATSDLPEQQGTRTTVSLWGIVKPQEVDENCYDSDYPYCCNCYSPHIMTTKQKFELYITCLLLLRFYRLLSIQTCVRANPHANRVITALATSLPASVCACRARQVV